MLPLKKKKEGAERYTRQSAFADAAAQEEKGRG
jgi:hypothetical protein